MSKRLDLQTIFGKIKALFQDPVRRKELATYILFGVLTTLVNWVVYWLMTRLTGMDGYEKNSSGYVLTGNLSNLVAWVVSVAFAFVTNKKYVFKSQKTVKTGALRELLMFFGARVASYLIFDVALYTLCLFVMNDLLDKLLMNILVVIFNYVVSKWVIFKKDHGKDAMA